MSISRGTAERRLAAANYNAVTRRRAMAAFGDRNRASITQIAGAVGAGSADMARVLSGQKTTRYNPKS